MLAAKLGQFTVEHGIAGYGYGHGWDWTQWGRIRVEKDGSRAHCSRIVRYRIRRYPAASELIARFAEVGEDA